MKIRYARRVMFSTDDSAVPVTITWPDPMTPAEFDDLKEFVAIWMNGLQRRMRQAALRPCTGCNSVVCVCEEIASTQFAERAGAPSSATESEEVAK